MGMTIGIRFGALCPSIHEQLAEQGIKDDPEKYATCQKMADAVTLLAIHGIMPDGEVRKARQRLVKRIVEEVDREHV